MTIRRFARPELVAEIEDVAAIAAAEMRDRGAFMVVLEPGDATRYELFGVATASGSIAIGTTNLGWSGYTFAGGFNVPHYVAEKAHMDIANEHSAAVAADFINALFESLDR